MSKNPKKTSLLVFVNSFKREIYSISSDFSTTIGKTESDKVIHNLAKDIAAIPFFLEKTVMMNMIGYWDLYAIILFWIV